MTTNSEPTAKGGRHPSAEPRGDAHPAERGEPTCGLPGNDPIQRWLVTIALALVAALIAASQTGCGGGPDEPGEVDERAWRPAEPASGARI